MAATLLVPGRVERRMLGAPDAALRVMTPTAMAGSTIRGYAAIFDSPSEDLGGYVEILAPGAFTSAIAASDVRALFNHNPNYVLGRVKARTLTLTEDRRGLKVEIRPSARSTWARDVVDSIQRGDIDGMSFGFKVAPGGAQWSMRSDGVRTRTVTKIEKLLDVSIVTFPAYPATSVAVGALGDVGELPRAASLNLAYLRHQYRYAPPALTRFWGRQLDAALADEISRQKAARRQPPAR